MALFQLDDGSKCPTLDFSVGERAMIIKDNVGDWAIVVGRWDKFRKGVPAVKGITFPFSHLSTTLYLLRSFLYAKFALKFTSFSVPVRVSNIGFNALRLTAEWLILILVNFCL